MEKGNKKRIKCVLDTCIQVDYNDGKLTYEGGCHYENVISLVWGRQ